MIALIQRVTHASLKIENETHCRIGQGLVVLLGIEKDDTQAQGEKLLRRILDYRVFPDEQQRMNRSLRDIDGELLLVSQFTLAADTNSGLRPGFSTAMPPEQAETLYNNLVDFLHNEHNRIATGIFGANMKILLESNGPVTFTLKS